MPFDEFAVLKQQMKETLDLYLMDSGQKSFIKQNVVIWNIGLREKLNLQRLTIHLIIIITKVTMRGLN